MIASWYYQINLQPDFQIAVTHSILKLKSFLNTTTQNDLKWRKTCTGLKFDLEHFNGPQTKFIGNSLYKHPVLHIPLKLDEAQIKANNINSNRFPLRWSEDGDRVQAAADQRAADHLPPLLPAAADVLRHHILQGLLL